MFMSANLVISEVVYGQLIAEQLSNLNDRVQRTVSAYGQSKVLLYLRAIAHLSHV